MASRPTTPQSSPLPAGAASDVDTTDASKLDEAAPTQEKTSQSDLKQTMSISKLVLLFVSVLTSMFLVGLDRSIISTVRSQPSPRISAYAITAEIAFDLVLNLISIRPSLALPMNSTPFPMWVGTMAPTCSPAVRFSSFTARYTPSTLSSTRFSPASSSLKLVLRSVARRRTRSPSSLAGPYPGSAPQVSLLEQYVEAMTLSRILWVTD